MSAIKNPPVNINIPSWIFWVQCISFVVLYSFWILPHIVGVRNSALLIGSIAGLYPIYQARSYFFRKQALPIWLVVGLFCWTIFHLVFLSQDPQLQFLEFKRIWKYAAIGSIFALGLGISLVVKKSKIFLTWPMIYLGLAGPVLVYLLKYFFTTYGTKLGLVVPASLDINNPTFYIPKTDYVAFCLPMLAVTLGRIYSWLQTQFRFRLKDSYYLVIHFGVISATLFLFYAQNIKNGIAYSMLCIGLFALLILFKCPYVQFWKKLLWIALGFFILGVSLFPHVQKNDSWSTLAADTKIALQTDQYQHWKYAGNQGYPNNEFGKMVSITNYERAAWLKIGSKLAIQAPLGYGLVEDSFKRMVKNEWPEASPNLSHSHSGWLDFILAMGFPGFLLLICALILTLVQSHTLSGPWCDLVFWGMLANLLLWCTTEVSATVTLPALIFWVTWCAGINMMAATKAK